MYNMLYDIMECMCVYHNLFYLNFSNFVVISVL